MKACEKYVFNEMYLEWIRKLENGSMFLFSQIWDKNAFGKFWRYSAVPPRYAWCEINYIFPSVHNDVNFLHKNDTIHFQFLEKKTRKFFQAQKHARFVILRNLSFYSLNSRAKSDTKALFVKSLSFSSSKQHENHRNHSNQSSLKSEISRRMMKGIWSLC